MLLVHAESARVLDELIERYHTPELMQQYGARLHAMTRPNFIEAEAIQRAAMWSEVTGGQLYIVHMSTREGADIIKAAQARGVPVLAETCVQYLVLDDTVFAEPDGHLYACCPQLKTPADQERLWQGLRDGEVSVISTDTCTFTREQKAMWNGDWTKIPMGMPGLETLLPLTYTHGVLSGQLDIVEMVRKLSANPARIMGLYPRKGVIQARADADIAIIHPTKTITVDPASRAGNWPASRAPRCHAVKSSWTTTRSWRACRAAASGCTARRPVCSRSRSGPPNSCTFTNTCTRSRRDDRRGRAGLH
jgi:dihydropyrimidinase